MKVFKQAAVHYSLSIPSFVNKRNKCALTQKCPAGNKLSCQTQELTGCILTVYSSCSFYEVLGVRVGCLHRHLTLCLQREVGWIRRHDCWAESVQAVPLTHATYNSTPTSIKSVTVIVDPDFVISAWMCVLSACVSTKKKNFVLPSIFFMVGYMVFSGVVQLYGIDDDFRENGGVHMIC